MTDVTVGRSVPLEVGQRPQNTSLSVTLATDHPPIAIFDAFEPSSELRQDLLGNPRFGSPQLLFANVRRYGIDDKIWATRVDGNSQGRVQFDADKSSARLSIQSGNFERTYSSLQTKINFPYQPGRSMDASFGVQTSRGIANENVVIEFGAFDNLDGYGFRILYEGGKDKILVFRRTSSGETTGLFNREQIPYLAGYNDLMSSSAFEEIIEVGNTTATGYSSLNNGNRLDGSQNGAVDASGQITSTGHKLSLFNTALTQSHLTMYRVRYSWYGASGADFWAYVPLQKTPKPGIPRWVRMHSIPIGDNIPFPSLKNPDKPITFRIYRRADRTGANVPSANAYISTFGTSFSIDAGDPSPMDIFSANSATIDLTNANITPILGINIKPFIRSSTNTLTGASVDTPNQLRALPLSLSFSATEPTAFYLIKNPTITGNVFPTPAAGDLSAVAVASTLGTYTANTGKVLGVFYNGQMDGNTIDLTSIFSYNREYLAREAQISANSPGDSLYVMARRLGSITSSATASLMWGQQ
ncbi:MAG: hypothetical protein ACKPE3_28860 [Sphaerospermopsis kisseleviana]